jgi:ketopantoate hydroxymethyltransferase
MSRPQSSGWKSSRRGIAVFTVYDATLARAAASVGPDASIVGDALRPNALGIAFADVQLARMIHHTAVVRCGAPDAYLVQDMPEGALGIVLQGPPAGAAAAVTRAVGVITLGLGRADGCDGAVANSEALLGLIDLGSGASAGDVTRRRRASGPVLQIQCARMRHLTAAQPQRESGQGSSRQACGRLL